MFMWIRVLSLVAVMALVADQPARAQDAPSFYKGKTINIVVGFAPGGGSDLWARFLARHYSKHLPGEPSVIVQNMPGAGGFAAANYVYSAAAKDGTNLLLPSTSAFTPPMMGIANARWDTLKLQWIGNMTQDTSSCVASAKSGVKSIADAKDREVVFGSDGVDESASHHPRIMAKMFGFKIKVISGYKGTGPAMLAVDQGEIDARCSMWASLALTSRRDDIATGKIVPIMQVGAKPHQVFGKAPMMRDFARNDEERQIIDFLFGTIDISRPLAVAPEVPADRVAYLREGFWKAINSAELKAEAAKAQFDITPMTGELTQDAMRKALAVSQPVIDKAKLMIAE